MTSLQSLMIVWNLALFLLGSCTTEAGSAAITSVGIDLVKVTCRQDYVIRLLATIRLRWDQKVPRDNCIQEEDHCTLQLEKNFDSLSPDNEINCELVIICFRVMSWLHLSCRVFLHVLVCVT